MRVVLFRSPTGVSLHRPTDNPLLSHLFDSLIDLAFKRAGEQADSIGVVSKTRHVKERKPAEGIFDTAELEDCDLIVMASNGRRGLQKMLFGSQTSEVIALSKRPVLVLR
jgi:nucleotide-binding universal stress UspA family protein